MQIVVFDAESYYDPATGYSLSSMSTLDYIRDDRFKCLGFSLKVGDKPSIYVPEHLVEATLKKIKPQLEESGVIAHNAMFDMAILNWKYGIRPKVIFDTLSMARARGLQHKNKAGSLSLQALCTYFGLGDKAPLRPGMSQEELKLRATVDADLTVELFKRLLPFPKEELEHIDWTIRCFSEPAIWADTEMLQELIDTNEEKMTALLARTGYTIDDMRSPAIFASCLERMGVDAPLKWSAKLKRETWAFAKTDEGFVELLDSDDEEVALLAQARLASKASGDSDRAARLIRAAKHGPVPMPLGYVSTHTLRWNGIDGMNPQNFKRGGTVRRSLRAGPQRLFVVGDSGQIEARGVAFYCGQKDLTDLFASGTDVYSAFGTRAFGRTVSKATEYERFSSKTTVLGAGYGAGEETLYKQAQAEIRKRGLKLTPPTIETFAALKNSYRQGYSKVPEGWKALEGILGNPGKTWGPIVSKGDEWLLPYGLSLYFPNLRYEVYEDHKGEKRKGWRYDTRKGPTATWGGKLMENAVSSLCRGILAEQMRRIRHRLKDIEGRVVLMVHDEIVSIVPERYEAEARAIYQEEMTWAPEWAKGLPLACEIGVGESYGSAKK